MVMKHGGEIFSAIMTALSCTTTALERRFAAAPNHGELVLETIAHDLAAIRILLGAHVAGQMGWLCQCCEHGPEDHVTGECHAEGVDCQCNGYVAPKRLFTRGVA